MNAKNFINYYNDIDTLKEEDISLFQQTLDLLRIKYKDDYESIIKEENIDKINEIINIRDALKEESKDGKRREYFIKKRKEIIGTKKELYNRINEFFKNEVFVLKEKIAADFINDIKKEIKMFLTPESIMNNIKQIAKKSKIEINQFIEKLKKEGIEIHKNFISMAKSLFLSLFKSFQNIPIIEEAAEKEEFIYEIEDYKIEIKLEFDNRLLIRNLSDKEIRFVMIIKQSDLYNILFMEENSSKIIIIPQQIDNIKEDIKIKLIS